MLVESVSYPTAEEKDNPEEFSKKKPELVIEAASRLTALPIDILKSEFPADIDYEKDEAKLKSYCQELSQVSRLPWVLLSAGTDFERFRKEVEIACKAGASGFMAGRALWQEATHISSREERLNFFKSQTVSRLKELTRIADKWATPGMLRWALRMAGSRTCLKDGTGATNAGIFSKQGEAMRLSRLHGRRTRDSMHHRSSHKLDGDD